MVFLNFCKEARDLALSNRVLAYALANNSEVRHVSDRTEWCYAMRHVRRKQREICEALGFPGSEASVRLFRKIPVESAFPPTLRVLKMAMKRDPEILKMLGHFKEIRPAIIYLVSGEAVFKLVTPKLLAQANEGGDDANGSHMADMLLNIVYHADKMIRPPPLPRFSSVRGIREFHDRLMMQLEVERGRREQLRQQAADERARVRQRHAAAARKEHKPRTFPPPPLPGTEHILPITSAADLRREGRAQHNCVGSYAESVLNGKIYVYRVLKPERATLSIRPGFGGAWFISELKCTCNRDTSKGTRGTVLEWLDRYRLSL